MPPHHHPPLAGFTVRRRHIHEQTNRKRRGGGGLSGGLVTLPSLIPRQGLIDCLRYTMPLTLSCHYALTHTHTHMHMNTSVCTFSAGIMKCVSYDQGGCTCPLLSSVHLDLQSRLSTDFVSFFLAICLSSSSSHSLSLPQYLVTVSIAFQF